MTYATITTTREVLESMNTSQENQNQQPSICQSLLKRFSKVDSAIKS